MNHSQAKIMSSGRGFIAALDQSGGSTPKALAAYGIDKSAYSDEETMFDLVHEMRTRVIKSPAFNSEKILAAILFEKTMDCKIDGLYTADYLWQEKGIVPILKVDKGLAPVSDGVQMMNPMPGLDALLTRAGARNIFGTKMRSVVKEFNEKGIEKIVSQQFEIGKVILKAGLVPIVEPEVDIHSAQREKSEALLKKLIFEALDGLGADEKIMLKLSIPAIDDFYADLIAHQKVMRVVALSGGYSRDEANQNLAKNHGLIASFSRALLEGLSAKQDDAAFDAMLSDTVNSIYSASIT